MRRGQPPTWSLRLRPVCSLPPVAPMSSLSRRSLAVWMSSSPLLISKLPAAHSSATLHQACGAGASCPEAERMREPSTVAKASKRPD